MEITAAILCGGQSSRMGRLKEGVPMPDGRPMIEHVLAAVEPVASEVLFVGACHGWTIPDVPRYRRVDDKYPGEGPLGALVTILEQCSTNKMLVVPCDQPILTVQLIKKLSATKTDSVVCFKDQNGNRFDPFPGLFNRNSLIKLREAFNCGERSLRRALKQVQTEFVLITNEEVVCLRNVNRPEDLH